MSSNCTVTDDASMLYPAPLRELLMRWSLTDLYRGRWTDTSYDEWARNVRKQWPDLKVEDLERTRSLMNAQVRDSLATGFELLRHRYIVPAGWRTGPESNCGRRQERLRRTAC